MALKNDTEGRKKLQDEIAEIEAAAGGSPVATKLPDVKLEETVYNAPTDEQLAQAAKDKLAEYKAQGIAAVESESRNEKEELVGRRDTYESDMQGSLDALKSSYDDAAERIDNDVIKRGLARSSVAVTTKGELENEYLDKADRIRSEYGKQIVALDSEISAIGTKLKQALDDFNIAYAAKLNETLAALKSEREKKIDDALKYNNEIRYKQAELDAKKAETESKLYSNSLAQLEKFYSITPGGLEKRDAMYQSIYDKMDAYLGSMSSTDAKAEIRNHTFYSQHLSDALFYKLFNKYGR